METTLTVVILALVAGIVATALYVIHFCKKKAGYKFVAYTSILLSALALFCSIRNNPFEISDIGAIIGVIAGVIAIPTAIVIGWQIHVTLNAQKMIEEIQKNREDITKEAHDIVEKEKLSYQTDMTFTVPLIVKRLNGDNVELVSSCIRIFALKTIDEDSFAKSLSYEYAIQSLKALSTLNDKLQRDNAVKIADSIPRDAFEIFKSEVFTKETGDIRTEAFERLLRQIDSNLK